MKETIEFSVMSYHPSIVTDENINVGILFHMLNSGERSFYITKNWKRLESFDDELDIEFMKEYLNGVASEVKREPSLFESRPAFSMEDFTRFYVNDLRFGDVRSANVNDAKEFIDQTINICMRYDFKKEDRISKSSELGYLKRLMRSNKIKYKTNPIRGEYDEKVKFDFIVNKSCFKYFTFADKKLNLMMDSAKAWAFTAQSLEDEYKIIFIYDLARSDSEYYASIKKILEKYARFVSRENIVEVINEASGENENAQTSLSIAV